MNFAGLSFDIIFLRLPELLILTIILSLVFLYFKKIYSSDKHRTILLFLASFVMAIALILGLFVGYTEGTKVSIEDTIKEWCEGDTDNLDYCRDACIILGDPMKSDSDVCRR